MRACLRYTKNSRTKKITRGKLMTIDSLSKDHFALNKTEKRIRRKRREKIFVDRAEKVICNALEKFLAQEGIEFDRDSLDLESRKLAKALAARFGKYSNSDISGLDVQDESAFFDALLQQVTSKS